MAPGQRGTASTKGEQQRRRVVLFPCPFQGHINPMLQLATVLHSQSKGALSLIVVHTELNSPNPSNYPDFTFLPISDATCSQTKDAATFLRLMNENYVSSFRDCLVSEMSKQNEPPVSCIITDAWMYLTQSVADDLQLPRLVLRTGSASISLVFNAIPLFYQKGYFPIKEAEMDTSVLELPPLKVKDIAMFPADKSDEMHQLISLMVNQIKASSGLILNTFASLEQSELESLGKELDFQIFPIGPLHKCAPESHSSLLEEDDSCLSWLDTQDPSSVIYISFGSVAAIDEAQFREIALGIVESEQPFLWVIRPGLVARSSTSDDFTELLPKEFSGIGARGCIVKWAPQQKVLAHPAVGGFWTHNGWNSTLESICEGVPMLCSPSFGDQKVNARYVSEVWKVGFYMENVLERREVETYIRRLMVKEDNKEREEMMVNARNLQEKAQICLWPEGSSHKSLKSLTDYIFSI